jgi:hypothetical protein
VFVTVWRDTLLPPPAMAGTDGGVMGDASGLPPPQFGGAGCEWRAAEGGRVDAAVVRQAARAWQ